MRKILVFPVAMLPVAGSFAQTQWKVDNQQRSYTSYEPVGFFENTIDFTFSWRSHEIERFESGDVRTKQHRKNACTVFRSR